MCSLHLGLGAGGPVPYPLIVGVSPSAPRQGATDADDEGHGDLESPVNDYTNLGADDDG
jgi:hypothetical protein